MKNLSTVIFLLTTLLAVSQKNFKTYNAPISNGYIIFADNNEYAPVSVVIEYTLQNMTSGLKSKSVLVPARSQKFVLDTILVKDKTKKGKYVMESLLYYGDVTNIDYDSNIEYHLPFLKDREFKVDQGYNGSFSHQNIYAIDFATPMKTEITASRAGIVIDVVSNFNFGCPEVRCKESANFITIMHDDGTFADYAHLKQNGSLVKIGDVVKQDQVIGFSGNTGWSSAPHLHFSVYKYSLKGQQTIETKFLIGGNKVVKLLQGQIYRKDY